MPNLTPAARTTVPYRSASTTFRAVRTSAGVFAIEKARTDAAGGTSWEEFETVDTTSTATSCALITPAIIAGLLEELV